MMVVAKQSSRHKMWTEITRRKYEREGQRYASDLTHAEWALIEPHMPAAKRLGRPRATELRAVLDAILYIARTGCQWRMLPKEFPPLTSRPGEFHPEPLTDPDLTLSRHPARATERRLPPPVENWSSSCCQLAHSQRR